MRDVWRPIKAALLQVHSLVGLVLALLWAVVGLTGATMAFEDEIEASLNSQTMRVEASATQRLTPDELIARLAAAGDFSKVSAVTMSSDPSAAARIRFARSEGGTRPSSVYVDPYDGHVLGSPRGEDFFATVRKLHRWLLLPGDGNGIGRKITGSAAICLIVMLITSLVLRWPRRARSVRMWLTLTGLWYSFEWYKAGANWLFARPQAIAAAVPSKPPRSASAAESKGGAKAEAKTEAKAEAKPLAFDHVWSAFLQQENNSYGRALMTLPPGAGTAVRVRSWPQDSTREAVRDEFRIDALTGRVISSDRYADKTFGERVLTSVLDIHRGAILGWPGKLAFMLAAAMMPLFAVTGLLLYLSCRKHRRLARPPVGHLVPGE
ncbi:PepSY domain-containing protein [Bradyrhizobium pachyrhizi]|uniref:PepSY domain-containing protein n=1 Tax=Bradyrhizobium pachyrhizi TaxID=280333 RepID=A0A844SDA2_9BRAD|nr:PepSY-associated TM helix domain-containing protein [Bradyrhizobium pachyrhizi]MVT63526.1 PepSY domain-containing protein [Bradyrhizobium pachyrhizi]